MNFEEIELAANQASGNLGNSYFPRHEDYSNWSNRTICSCTKPLKKFVKTLRLHEVLLTNYFKA